MFTLSHQLPDAIKGRNSVGFGQARKIEGGAQKVLDGAAVTHHGLADVDQLAGLVADSVGGPCLPPDISFLSQGRSHSPSGYGGLVGEVVLEFQLLRGCLSDFCVISGETGVFAQDGQARTAP